jgi:hypothetical protein
MNPSTGIPSDFERGPSFGRAVSQFATDFLSLDIDLSVAGQNVIFDINGEFLYIDPDAGGNMTAGGVSISGFASIELNNQQNAPSAPLFVQSGFALNAIFNQIKVNWPAQPGKKLRIAYSTGARVVPTNGAVVTGSVSISGGGTIINPALFNREAPFQYGASYKSITNMAANTSDVVFLPAANINGAIIWRASGFSGNAVSMSLFSLVAHSSAPNSPVVGDSLVVHDNAVLVSGVTYVSFLKLERPVFVSAGKGVYFNTTLAESGAFRNCLYSLL